jgi:hypothetical protein
MYGWRLFINLLPPEEKVIGLGHDRFGVRSSFPGTFVGGQICFQKLYIDSIRAWHGAEWILGGLERFS